MAKIDFFDEVCSDCGQRSNTWVKRCSCGNERDVTSEIKSLVTDYRMIQRQINYHTEAANKAAKEQPSITPKKKEEMYMEDIKKQLESELPYLNRFVFFHFTPNGKQGADITIQVIIDSVLYKQTLTEVKDVESPRWILWTQKLKEDGAKDNYDWLCLLSKVRHHNMGNRNSMSLDDGCVVIQSRDVYVTMMKQWCEDTIREYFNNPERRKIQEYKLIQLTTSSENIAFVRRQVKTYVSNIKDAENEVKLANERIDRNIKALGELLHYNEFVNDIINDVVLPTFVSIPDKYVRLLPVGKK